MKKIKMLTVIPSNLAMELMKKKRIKDFNTLPQLNSSTLAAIREYMTKHVGYSNSPIACLSSLGRGKEAISGEDILSYLPTNSKNCVVFQLEMPEDMVVSISFENLLSISNEANEIDPSDTFEMEFLQEKLADKLVLGFDDSMPDPVSFIPFLAVDKCKSYAKLDANFDTETLELPGLAQMSLRELTSFMN